ncbi:naringenin 8-dimethylallyltransferase 2, chloroplastic-like isoform X1 [Arachis stenosperma]|uniref:naringenin 8-dimethylallyltransferase 2, chloroplastic-like isoform X1 n=1 Tax=Arachis stenosperma TaxID=217475 RepID=UPI0025ACBCB9|nr:naringenin 8-dimethylallyltransferase 2, chloroplastic-like isoform X1 [Arachis stenosperma]
MASTSRLLLHGSLPPPTTSISKTITGSHAVRALWHNNGKYPKEKTCIETPLLLQHNQKNHYTCDQIKRKHFVNATHAQSKNEPESQPDSAKPIWNSIKDVTHTIQKFSVFYALIGLLSGILSSSLLAVEKLSDLSPTFFISMLQFMAAYSSMQLYTTGVNQLADIEIDKINKPYRPLASSKISFGGGLAIVAASLFMSFGLALMIGSKPLLWGLILIFILMTAYSVNLPFLRWKKSTILTLLSGVPTILTAYNLAPYLHMKTFVLKKPFIFTRSLAFTTVVMTFFYVVISLFKDIPDIEGDKKEGLQTLSIRLGPKRVFWLCISLLEMTYGIAIIMGLTSPFLWSKIFTVMAHAINAWILWFRANSVDLKSKEDFQSFYMFIFKLLYLENVLVLFVR